MPRATKRPGPRGRRWVRYLAVSVSWHTDGSGRAMLTYMLEGDSHVHSVSLRTEEGEPPSLVELTERLMVSACEVHGCVLADGVLPS